jgi:iron complex outermembrane receptor protein
MIEFGAKWTSSQDRIQLNSAVFRYDYKDLQVFTQSFVDDFPVDRIENAADAEISGLELELSVRPTEFLFAQLSAAYLDTKAKDFFSVSGLDEDGQEILEDLSGLRLTFAPEWSLGGLVRANWPMGTGEVSGQISFNYLSEYFFDADNAPLNAGGSYTLWNARVAWESRDRSLEVSFAGQNLFNKLYFTEGFDLLAAQNLFVGRPRTWLASITKRW